MTAVLDTTTAGQAASAATGNRPSTGASGASSPLLSISHLDIGFDTPTGHRHVVSDVSLELGRGQCLALVGESGSGKSVTARTLVGLTGKRATVSAERLELGGSHELDLRAVSPAGWRQVRGGRIGFVLQDALVSLDPLRPVGREIDEALRLHTDLDHAQRRRRVIELLDSVGVPQPELRAGQRPDQLSGGLRQRALIAAALAGEPELIIADEPTTALDVTVQRQVLGLLKDTIARGVGVLLISHDLSVVGELADTIAVMQGGRIVEQGPTARVLGDPQHEYTRSLLAAVPSAATRGRRLSSDDNTPVDDAGDAVAAPEAPHTVDGDVVLRATGLRKSFATPRGRHHAVRDVSFALRRGTTLGIVGESGSGKSTTARLVLGLETPDAGEVLLDEAPWSALSERKRRPQRRRIAVVQQDPLSSFDPRWTVERILRDALPASLWRAERGARIASLLEHVRLPSATAERLPLTLSGGQRQRVAIARALASAPEVILLDEAVSALDVSVQAQILDLLVELRDRLGLSYLFISHDLGVIAHLSDDVLVMRGGEVVESGDVSSVFGSPQHPYTAELLSSLPTASTITSAATEGDDA